MFSTWRRFRALEPIDRSLVLQAAALVIGVWIGIHLAPFHPVRQVLARRWRSHQRSGVSPGRIGWAVDAVCRRLPRRPTCLVEALAAEVLLRRHGLVPRLQFGVRRETRGKQTLDAHAWVECGGEVVVGRVDRFDEYVALSPPPSRSA